MWFWWHDYFAPKIHIYSFWVDVNWQQDCFVAGDCKDIHAIKHCWVYRLRYTSRCHFGGLKKYKWQECFPIHEIGRINGGRGFRIGGKVLRIGGNTFYNQKHKIPMKIPDFKRSGIGIMAEFRGIPSGFPNQDVNVTGFHQISHIDFSHA